MSQSGLQDADVVLELCSLYEAAFQEARRHRWIESQKSGCDLGNERFIEWYDRYWENFLRYRHLEHLFGDREWREFDPAAFGALAPLLNSKDDLVLELIGLYRQGWQNLDIVNWAIRTGLDLEEVRERLVLINMNDARIAPKLS